MALETYRSKRDFAASPEPEGKAPVPHDEDLGFVIQKHDARRLHYDFRLELGGVLLSWAVTRGPSLDPGEKRLAVHVEDHPLDYADFEGTIPKGEYGGGEVIVWDRGTWHPEHDPVKALAKGHLDFDLRGEKLRGRWHLVRMARRPRDKRENWLLIKGADDFARAPGDPDILEEKPASVKTGRALAAVEAPRKKPGKSKAPDFIPPSLATPRPNAPTGAHWLHEIKFDGYRLQAHLRDGRARLLTRTGLDWTARFGPDVPAALAGLAASEAILDGELVVETGNGASDFGTLQADLAEGRTDRFRYYAFDLLFLDGTDLRRVPLETRKARLAALLDKAPDPLRLSGHFVEEGEMILRHACRLGLEGIVSKRRDGAYVSGRTTAWIKSKCSDRQEFVILGYMPSSTGTEAIGSLLLGHYEEGRLIPAGRVGTGFTQAVARDLHRRLAPLRRAEPAFEGAKAADRREARFVEPDLVAEVEFANWTADGLLRHARFRGLREDKPAREVVRETEAKGNDMPRSTVKLTHPDRIYWSDAGVTKEGLAGYYTQVWPRMAPHVTGRPLALLRCPEGTGGSCFFQKHAWKGQSKEILTAPDPLSEDESPQEIVGIGGLDGLIGLVQGAALEIHCWQPTLTDLEHPDQIVMDLDPGEGLDWAAIVAGAEEVRARLRDAGLATFVKTSGGKGLHVVVPLTPKAGWDKVRSFTRSIARAMAADSPDQYVATVTKAKRRGRILIDYLRNGRGATAVAPWSSRARPGAPVSMPLPWEDLPGIRPDQFTVPTALARLAEPDPWADFRAAATPLPSPRRRRRAGG